MEIKRFFQVFISVVIAIILISVWTVYLLYVKIGFYDFSLFSLLWRLGLSVVLILISYFVSRWAK